MYNLIEQLKWANYKQSLFVEKSCWSTTILHKILTFSSNFFFSSLNWFILCLRNSLSCDTSFSVDASFCSSSSCWGWDNDCSENGVWTELFSYCGYWEKIMADKSSEAYLSLTNKHKMGRGYSAKPISSRIRLSSN